MCGANFVMWIYPFGCVNLSLEHFRGIFPVMLLKLWKKKLLIIQALELSLGDNLNLTLERSARLVLL